MTAPFAEQRPRLTLLAVSGSLRRLSSNTAVLGALARLAPAGVAIVLYDDLAALPAFNPDLDDDPPPAVLRWRGLVGQADGLLVSSPEYARGVAGALKNALDWLVSGPEMPGKPVALVNTSPRAVHAPAALALTLETMSARLVANACVTVPLLGRTLDAAAIAADPDSADVLRNALVAFVAAIRSGPAHAADQ